jgi:hypothetical protein
MYDVLNPDEPLEAVEKNFVFKLSEMVAPLDITVTCLFAGHEPVVLNRPLLYEQDQETIWRFVSERRSVYSSDVTIGVSAAPNQQKMLIPMGDSEGLFGYAGLNIGRRSQGALKSVGGLAALDRTIVQPIWGVAEYKPAGANREPGELAAPPDVIKVWVDQQIHLMKTLSLSEDEFQDALDSLHTLNADVSPVFRVLTTKGPLCLDDFIVALTEARRALFPVTHYDRFGITRVFSSLPSLYRGSASMQLEAGQIQFERFAVYSDVIPSETTELDEAQNTNLWGVIIGALRSRGLGYKIVVKDSSVIGKYIGLDSEIHGLSKGSQIKSSIVEIELT